MSKTQNIANIPNGTANGVLYLNGSKVATSGSALTFDGTNISNAGRYIVTANSSGTTDVSYGRFSGGAWINTPTGAPGYLSVAGNAAFYWDNNNLISYISGSEAMRLTSTGLGIGTSSPSSALYVKRTSGNVGIYADYNGTNVGRLEAATNGNLYIGTTTGSGAVIIGNTANANAVYLDSSGNLGLGVTPSAWYASGSGWKALQVGAFGILSNTATNDSRLMSNAYLNTGGSYIYLNSSQYATNYIQTSGQHQWFTAPSGTAGNAITFTQAMTLDASANLFVNATSDTGNVNAGSRLLSITGNNTNPPEIKCNGSDAEISIAGGSSASYLWSTGAYPLVIATNSTERARITSGGDLLVGRTSQFGSERVSIESASANIVLTTYNFTATSVTHHEIRNQNGVVGSIVANGGNTSYNTSSDYRLKEDIQPMTGALAKVATLKPVTYKWKSDGSDGEGFIAHELADVCPHAVTGEKDALDAEGKPVYQGIDTSFLVATLTAAIQEQQALIESLTSRVAQLEGTQP